MTNEEALDRMTEMGFTFQFGLSPVRYRLRDGAMAVILPMEGTDGRFQIAVHDPVSLEVGD